MKRVMTVACIVSLAVLGAGCQRGGAGDPEREAWEAAVRSSLEFVKRVPEEEARAAIDRGDYRFIGIMRYALEIPGVSDDARERYCERYPPRVLEGTSDVIASDEDMALMVRAPPFAERYNEVICEYLMNAEPGRSSGSN